MWWVYALWGLFGGFAVEGLEFAGAIRRTGGWPWRQAGEPGPVPLLVSVIVRLAVSAGLTAAVAASNQVSGPFGALTIGAGAPLIFEQIVRQAAGSASAYAVPVHAKAHIVGPPSDGSEETASTSALSAEERS